MGRWLGLQRFGSDDDKEADSMKCELRKAASADRYAIRKTNKSKKAVLAAIMGKSGPQITSQYRDAMLAWIADIRTIFAGAVIRRTTKSLDVEGKAISLLDPYEERLLVVKLYPNEIANLEQLASNMMNEGGHQGAKFAGGSVSNVSPLFSMGQFLTYQQNFYLPVRRALVHPSCNNADTWTNPSTLEEWRQVASRKLDVLASVIKYHLEQDGLPAMTMQNDVLAPGHLGVQSPTDLPCDKIVVYSAFPSSNLQIVKVIG